MDDATERRSDARRIGSRSPAFLALFVLLLGWVTTALVARQFWLTSVERDRQTFERNVQRQEDIIVGRVNTYVALLRATAGVVLSYNGNIDAESFRLYQSRIAIRENYPGIYGIGFTRRVLPDQIESLVQYMQTQGQPDFRIYPEHEREEYHAILFLEPLDRRNQVAIGYDMFSESIRRRAMERARDRHEPAMSGRVTLVQEIDVKKQPGFLIYVPVFDDHDDPQTVEERRARLIGYAYSPFRAWDLFESIAEEDQYRAVAFAVYDGLRVDPEALLYRTDDYLNESKFSATRQIEIAGHPWTLAFTGNAGFVSRSGDQRGAWLALISGVMLSLLLSMLVWVEARSRRNAELDRQRLAMVNEKLRQSELELEKRVEERTAQLLSANEQLQGFAYSVAHDLRQQIRGISSNAAMALEDAPAMQPELRDTLQRLARSAKQLGTLVDDLLAFSRLERLIPEFTLVDISAIAQDVAAHLKEDNPRYRTAQIVIDPHLEAMGDLTLLRVAIENLIDNALKYSASSEAPVIRVGKVGDAFFIRDNGVGFEMEYAHKLFEPFERLHRDDTIEGTGIGLANVRRIIEKHGGRVWAESLPGQGATFYFTLPHSEA
jgi:CHASE1-domain containing sensor protein/nitrogen-specific signal transduction histidine kinase